MTSNILAICLANLLMWALGAGLVPLLGLAATRRQLVARLPLAYAVGLVGTGLLASELALVDVPVGRVGLPILAVASLALGYRRLRRGTSGAATGLRWSQLLLATALLAAAGAYLANAARLFAVKPLLENDGWALWGMRARAIYDFGHPVAPVFTQSQYAGLQYPLLLPELEAIDFRFMGFFDGTLVHLQLLGFAIALVAGGWTLLRRSAPPILLAATLLAVVTAPVFFGQLQTNYADIPLAVLIALGVAALAAWLRSGERGLLPAATLFLAGGALVKNEGELFALAAYIAALASARREQRRALFAASAATVAVVAPWHLWLLAHGVTSTTFSLSHLLHPAYLTSHWHRVGTALHELFTNIKPASSWSLLPVLTIAGVLGSLALRRYRIAAFGASWLLLSFAGLLLAYYASPLPLGNDLYYSANRTVDTLIIGGALIAPVLLQLDRPADPSQASADWITSEGTGAPGASPTSRDEAT